MKIKIKHIFFILLAFFYLGYIPTGLAYIKGNKTEEILDIIWLITSIPVGLVAIITTIFLIGSSLIMIGEIVIFSAKD